MKTNFTPIAMKCTQEQFDAIKPKLEEAQLEIKNIHSFDELEYLTSDYGSRRLITNTHLSYSANERRQVYHTWDEDVFLQACGIGVDQYTVPKDFILEAHKEACSTWKKKIEKQFPKLFAKPQFEIGKWYVNNYGATWLYQGDDVPTYGFLSSGTYTKDQFIDWGPKLKLADPQSVEDLLKQHAFKLGIKKGATVVRTPQMLSDAKVPGVSLEVELCLNKVNFDQDLNSLSIDGRTVFVKGQWAEVKPVVTKYTVAQLEHMLGHKIEIISEK